MRSHIRHAFGLVIVLILSAGLTGCYRSVGGTLEPTPVNVDVNITQVAQAPTLPPTFTPLAGESETPVLGEPTAEVITPLPSPIPPSPTTQVDAAPAGQGGPVDSTGPSPTFTVTMQVVAVVPSLTPVPAATNTPLPSATNTPIPPTDTPTHTPIPPTPTDTQTPTVTPGGPTATFTSVPFNAPPPSPTYTPFVPPGQAQEAQPLAERPPDTPVPTDGQGGPVDAGGAGVTEEPVAVAQGPTLSPNQATATALVFGATATAAAAQGTILPPPGATEAPAGQQPAEPTVAQGGVIIVTATPAQAAGQCDSHLISPGETLYRIAALYNVTVNQIAQANNIVNPDLIRAGDTLVIPCPVPATATPVPAAGQGGQAGGTTTTAGGTTVYLVEPGDNLYQISIRFGVSMTALMQANGMTPATINMIYAGKELIIPASTIVQPTPIPTVPGGVIVITATPGG